MTKTPFLYEESEPSDLKLQETFQFLCSERLPFNFFAFSPDFDHPKTYITSKKIRIKALKSKLKQVVRSM